jgi:hypothetical protein
MATKRRSKRRGKTIQDLVAVFGKAEFEDNLARVRHLIQIYRELPKHLAGRRFEVGTEDLLRAAVVLLHASLEELLRRIAKYRIPRGDEEALKEIPLLHKRDRATKFPLGSLVPFRGDSVDDVLRWSVHAYYERQTFNNIPDIKEVLSRSRVDDAAVRNLYPEIAKFITRRHSIVHRADRGSIKAGAIGHGPIMNINSRTVARWATVSDQFANKILRQFVGRRHLRRL